MIIIEILLLQMCPDKYYALLGGASRAVPSY